MNPEKNETPPQHLEEKKQEAVVSKMERLLFNSSQQENSSNSNNNSSDSEITKKKLELERDVQQLRTSFEIQLREASTEISPNEVKVYYEIGHGSFGRVFAGICRGSEVAVKYIQHAEEVTQRQLDNFRKEIQILSNVQHKNVLLYLGANTQTEPFFIVTEKMSDSVGKLLKNKTEISMPMRIGMAKDCAAGMAWLHGAKPQILHRDLKPDNLLVDEEWNVKVCDFGLSQVKLVNEKIKDSKRKGSPLWMAPEVMMDQEVDEKADVYSFGLVLWEIVTGCKLFPEFISFPSFKLSVCRNNMRPKIMNVNYHGLDIPPSANEMMQLCWQKDPKARPSFHEILKNLELIMVECSIHSPQGSKFWQKSFGGKKNVEWSLFHECYFKEYPTQDVKEIDLNTVCLKQFISSPNPHPSKVYDPYMVTIEAFSLLLTCFGPLDDGAQILARLRGVLASPWFHGLILRPEAENRLRMALPGAHLVRISTTERDAPFALSIRPVTGEDTVHHIRIYLKEGRYSLSDPWHKKNFSALSLVELIAAAAPEIGLQHSCFGNPYLALFRQEEEIDADSSPYDPYGGKKNRQEVSEIQSKESYHQELEQLAFLLNEDDE